MNTTTTMSRPAVASRGCGTAGKGCRQHLTLCWPVTGVSLFVSLDRLALPTPSCVNLHASLPPTPTPSPSVYLSLNSICIMLWQKVDNHLPVRHFNLSRLESLKTDSGKVYSINPLAKVIDKAFNCFRKWQLSVWQAVSQAVCRSIRHPVKQAVGSVGAVGVLAAYVACHILTNCNQIFNFALPKTVRQSVRQRLGAAGSWQRVLGNS